MTNFETLLIHSKNSTDEKTGAVNVPIYQTSTFKQDGLGQHKEYEYSRTQNPTREVLEKLIAQLENGKYGFAFASGLAAITTILALFKSGDNIVISNNVYGGTFRLLYQVFNNFGITFSIAQNDDWKKAISENKNTKAVLIESPANPLLSITDINEVSKIAHKYGALSIVDNTFMTPYLQRPLDLGADIVIHSATKYLGGHCDVVAGLIAVQDDKLGEKLAFLQNSIGAILEPFDSYLLIRGIKTLALRMDRISENAQYTAEFLLNHKAVKKVYYPGLKNSNGYETHFKQAKTGGGMISFELKENYDIKKFFSSLEMIMLAESLGGVESLVCHPSSMTHASIPEEIRKKIGITDGLIRLSIGIEHREDIIKDLEQAVRKAGM